MAQFDSIIIGTGGVGSAAAYHLAKRGQRVLGLDRFEGGHDRGSSHGETRIIRKAYFEHPDYVPLLERAYVLWRELEEIRNEELYREVGLVEIGPPDGVIVPNVLQAAKEHNLDVDLVDPGDFADRFPALQLPDGHAAVFEREAGFLFVERCVLAHLSQAKSHGAEFRTGVEVTGWKTEGDSVVVSTNRGSFTANSLVICGGSWTQQLLGELGIPFRILRKHLHWYASDDLTSDSNGFPGFFYETNGGYFYGFPKIDDLGLKVSEHSGGTEIVDPLNDPREIEPLDRSRVEAFLRDHIPSVSNQPTRHEVCFYTMSPDENFIIDRHPDHDNVVFAAGLSGHGFKMANVLGEILAQLTAREGTKLETEFLSLGRFG
ncbi:MAG: N-methyl-L-tryptophan oxidase [Verrucomicrobiota bacterium]